MFMDIAPRSYKGPRLFKKKGLILVFTGTGKGKTTAAFGTVLRALGQGMRVAIVQFIKGGWVSSEMKALQKFKNQVEVHIIGEGFTWDTQDFVRERRIAQKGWDLCVKLLKKRKHDLYVFDEVLYALQYQFLKQGDVIRGVRLKSPESHVILTGRGASPGIVKIADVVTEMRVLKHPFSKGILAQPGIDF